MEERLPFKELDVQVVKEKRAGPATSNCASHKSPVRKKLRASLDGDENTGEHANVPEGTKEGYAESCSSGDVVEFSPSSVGSGPVLRFQGHDDDDSVGKRETSSVASTPPIDDVELNTRRNSLRPLSASSSRSLSRARHKEEGQRLSFESDNSDNQTVTLAAFQDLLDGAQSESSAGSGKGTASPALVNASADDDSSIKYVEESDAEDGGDASSRRNTASPSFLRDMLELSGDEDEEEMIEQAAQRGKKIAEELSESTEKILTTQQQQQEEEVVEEEEEEEEEDDNDTPIASRTRRGSAAKRQAASPTPLKSCLSARKVRAATSRIKKKSVVFGSPDAAEFDSKDPVKGGVTPLNKHFARTRYKMEQKVEDDLDGDLVEEDVKTALNSSILATWEEEESTAADDDEEKTSSGKKRRGKKSKRSGRRKSSGSESGASTSGSSASSGSSSRGRRSSGIYRPGSGGGDDLAPRFDQVAQDQSPTAMDTSIDKSPARFSNDHGGGGGGDDDERTVELGQLSELASFSAEKAPPPAIRLDSAAVTTTTTKDDDHTAELGKLSDLAAMSTQASKRSKRFGGGVQNDDDDDAMDHDGEERTVEVGKLAELANFDGQEDDHLMDENATSSAQENEQTVELGTLAQLASIGSAHSKRSPSSASMVGKKKSSRLDIRLSFSSLASGSDAQTPHSKAKENHAKVFNSSALLNQFLDTPDSSKGSTGKTSTPESMMMRSPVQQEAGSPFQDHGAFMPSHALARSPLDTQKSSTPKLQERQHSPAMTRSPDGVLLRGSPAQEEVDTHDDDDVAGKEEQPIQNTSATTTAKAEQMQRDEPEETLEGLLRRLNLLVYQVPEESQVGQPEPAIEQCTDEPEIASSELGGERINRACMVSSEIYSLKWAINEMRERAIVNRQTVGEIASDLEQQKTHTKMVRQLGQDGAQNALRRMAAQASCEARISVDDFAVKIAKLSTDAAKDHIRILEEDEELLRNGVARLDQAIAAAREELQAKQRLAVLEKQLSDQQAAANEYEKRAAQLLAAEKQLKEQVSMLQDECKSRQDAVSSVKHAAEILRVRDVALGQLQAEEMRASLQFSLQMWKAEQINSNELTIRLRPLARPFKSTVVSIAMNDVPAISRVTSRLSPDDSDTDLYECNFDSTRKILASMDASTQTRVQRRVAQLNKSMEGASPRHIPQLIRQLEFEFGHLYDLWEEIIQICQVGQPLCTFRLSFVPCGIHQDEENIELFVELLHHDAGAVLQVVFSISQGYPFRKGSLQAQVTAVGDDKIASELESILSSTFTCDPPCVTPLTQAWTSLLSVVGHF